MPVHTHVEARGEPRDFPLVILYFISKVSPWDWSSPFQLASRFPLGSSHPPFLGLIRLLGRKGLVGGMQGTCKGNPSPRRLRGQWSRAQFCDCSLKGLGVFSSEEVGLNVLKGYFNRLKFCLGEKVFWRALRDDIQVWKGIIILVYFTCSYICSFIYPIYTYPIYLFLVTHSLPRME